MNRSTGANENLRVLSDQQLLENTKNLATKEREIIVEVLQHLLEVNFRKLFSPRYKSLFEYATKELGYSEDQAARRISAMRLLKEVPQIETEISNGKLNLTTLGLAQTHFRNEATPTKEKAEILKSIEGKSTREVMRELVCRSSEPDRLRPETVKPVSETTNELTIYLKDEELEKISTLKGRFAHKHPHLSNSDLVKMLLDLALRQTDPAKEPSRVRKNDAAVPAAPRMKSAMADKSSDATSIEELQKVLDVATTNGNKKVSNSQARTPGRPLKREVWRSSNGQCQMCGSHHALEYDHQIPFALGGATTEQNLRLLCRNCNQRESIKMFGIRR